jgi:hypothetical protein
MVGALCAFGCIPKAHLALDSANHLLVVAESSSPLGNPFFVESTAYSGGSKKIPRLRASINSTSVFCSVFVAGGNYQQRSDERVTLIRVDMRRA